MTTCDHSCAEHCPPRLGPDPDLVLPPFPRRGGGRGTGTMTDRTFYKCLAGAYKLARNRYPAAPAQAVLRANPDVTVEQLRRAVHKATGLGFLERVRAERPDAPRPRATPVAVEPKPLPTDPWDLVRGSALSAPMKAGIPITADMLAHPMLHLVGSDAEAVELLDALATAGGVRAGDGVAFPAG